MKFSEIIRGIREERGLDQVDFAELIGVFSDIVEHWEDGFIDKSIEVMKRCAASLDMTVGELLDWERTRMQRWDVHATGTDDSYIELQPLVRTKAEAVAQVQEYLEARGASADDIKEIDCVKWEAD